RYILHEMPRDTPGLRQHKPERSPSNDACQRRREAPSRALQGAIGIDELGPNGPNPGMLVEMGYQAVNGPVENPGVGVQQQDVTTCAGDGANVCVRSEAIACALPYQANIGMVLDDELRRTVRRAVVDNDDLAA